MEYLQVFDKNKNVLNEKVSRLEKENLPSGKYFMVILIFIQNEKGEFLLQKTSKSRNSCVATTGGHVTYGYTSIETVIKECKEELGIDVLKSKISHVSTLQDNNCFLETYYTKMELEVDSLILQKEEVESVRWYTQEEIFDLIKNNKFRNANIEPYKNVLYFINSK